jgi:hypothetical protein
MREDNEKKSLEENGEEKKGKDCWNKHEARAAKLRCWNSQQPAAPVSRPTSLQDTN